MTEKFDRFAALHVPGDPVILYNIWDVGSAHAVEQAGAKALATGSHPVADANGWPDGQGVPIDFALANAARIVDATTLPRHGRFRRRLFHRSRCGRAQRLAACAHGCSRAATSRTR